MKNIKIDEKEIDALWSSLSGLSGAAGPYRDLLRQAYIAALTVRKRLRGEAKAADTTASANAALSKAERA